MLQKLIFLLFFHLIFYLDNIFIEDAHYSKINFRSQNCFG